MVQEGSKTATTLVYEQHRKRRTDSHYGKQTRAKRSEKAAVDSVLVTSYVLTKGSLCRLGMEQAAMQRQGRSASDSAVQDDHQH